MKNTILLYTTLGFIVIGLFVLTSWQEFQNKKIQSSPVSFTIKKMKLDEERDLMKLLLDMQVTEEDGTSFAGRGVLSLCSCYCDSIWDAWPPPPDNDSLFNIPGTGTLHYVSFGSPGDSPDGNRIKSGVIGIKEVEGGIERNTDFNLSISYLVDE